MPLSEQEPAISTSVLTSLYNDLSGHRKLFDLGLKTFNIPLSELQNFGGKISLPTFVSFLEWLAAEVDDPWLGLRASQKAGPEVLGAVGYLFLSSGKLETAFQSLSRYLEAIQDASRMNITYVKDFVEIKYQIIDDRIAPRRQDSEYSLGIIWRYIQLLSKSSCQLIQVNFEHNPPPDSSTIPSRIFKAPVLYNCEANELILRLVDFQKWHEGLDPHLFPILEDHIAHTLAHKTARPTFTESVAQILTEQILREGAQAELIAAMLNISTATLHRKLKLEGSRFKALVETRAKTLAERLLQHGNLPIASISTRLGFSNPATFSRAFRRWFGDSPREYRKRKQTLINLSL